MAFHFHQAAAPVLLRVMRSACSGKRDLMFALFVWPVQSIGQGSLLFNQAPGLREVEGSRDKRQDWVKKTGKGRCRRKRGVKAGETTDKCSKPCLSLHDFFFLPLTRTHFVPPASSLHICLPPSHLHFSCTCVTLIPHFLSASLFFVRCYAQHTHTRARSLPFFPTLNHLYSRVLNCPFRPCLLLIQPTSFPPFHQNFIQTHLSILFHVMPLSLTPLCYLFLLFLIGLLLFPKWIFVLTIQHLE